MFKDPEKVSVRLDATPWLSLAMYSGNGSILRTISNCGSFMIRLPLCMSQCTVVSMDLNYAFDHYNNGPYVEIEIILPKFNIPGYRRDF